MTTSATLIGTLTSLRFVFFSPSPATCFSTCLFWDLGHMLSCVAWWPSWYCLTVCISWPLLRLRETHYQVSLLISLLVTKGKWLASWLFWFMFFWHHQHVILINKHTLLTCLVSDQCYHKLVFIKMIIRHEPFNSNYFVSHISDFHKNIEELESPCGHQSDDGTTLHHQCLRHQSCGALGVVPPG